MDTADEVYRVNTTEAMCTECNQQKSKCNVQSRQCVQNVHNRHGVQNEQVYRKQTADKLYRVYGTVLCTL